MTSIKRILCPTDFSEFSEGALTYAMDLSVRFKAKLYVQHVMEDAFVLGSAMYAAPADLQCLAATYEQNIEARLNRWLDKELGHATLITQGRPPEEILKVAKEGKMDLIIMGAHGRKGLERLVLGSVTERVVERAPCPVLTVRHMTAQETRRPVGFRTILVPVDFSEHSFKALEYALALVEEYHAALYLLHVIERLPGSEMAGRWFDSVHYEKQHLADSWELLAHIIPQNVKEQYPVKEVVKTGSAHQEIINTAKEIEADLIVMGVAGEGTVRPALFGSTAYQVIKEAECPVLTVRRERGMKSAGRER